MSSRAQFLGVLAHTRALAHTNKHKHTHAHVHIHTYTCTTRTHTNTHPLLLGLLMSSVEINCFGPFIAFLIHEEYCLTSPLGPVVAHECLWIHAQFSLNHAIVQENREGRYPWQSWQTGVAVEEEKFDQRKRFGDGKCHKSAYSCLRWA